eukprot:PLAT6690.2.p1 GENE.PLAT6690.2~~PLAT6690.2.p1  ORF type:complete len:181 (-),score=90.50 PLAT6690.2:76-618(-)
MLVLVACRWALGMAMPAMMRGMPGGALPGLPPMPAFGSGAPTRFVQLLNIATVEMLADDDIYDDLIGDVFTECNSFGPVVTIIAPRPLAGSSGSEEEEAAEWAVGKVVVEFEKVDDAKRAQMNLAGRKYAGRFAITGFITEEVFARLTKEAEEGVGEEVPPAGASAGASTGMEVVAATVV